MKTNYLIFLFITTLLSFSICELDGQSVNGRITDEKNQPLPGVSVIIKGTQHGTVSNIDGEYTLAVDNIQNTILIFSFIGMIPDEQAVNGRTQIDVVLREKTEVLDEIVVIGYGTMKKKDFTGSVASVSAKELNDIPITNAAQAITGRLAGVQITTAEGSPDAEVKIRVRGGGSITQDNSPMYIIDGFPGDINTIPPSDIETVDVLKDATSTAIYGAKGANGVVIITTKKGIKGRTRVNYNFYVGEKKMTKQLDVLSPYEYVLAQYERAVPAVLDRRDFEKYFGTYNKLDSLYSSAEGTNWQDKVFGRKASTLYHNFSIDGGTDNSTYNLSYTNTKDEGIMLTSGYTRHNINFRFDTKAGERLRINFDAKLADTRVSGAGTSDAGASSVNRLKHSVIYRPVDGLIDFGDVAGVEFDDEQFYSLTGLTDPVLLTKDEYRKKHQTAANFNGAVDFTIIKNLQFRSEAGFSVRQERRDRFDGLSTYNARKYGGKPVASIEEIRTNTFRLSNTLNYSLKSGNHDIKMMLGQELINTMNQDFYMESRSFPETISPEMAIGSLGLGTSPVAPTTYETEEKMLSFFGRLNYSFRERYLASFTFREDGSSKFAPGHKWGFFPSVSAGWRITEEEFMKDIKYLSYLKLRLSYGEAGNNRIPDMLWRPTFKVGTDKLYYLNEVAMPFFYADPENLPNPKLRWETTISKDLGIDFGFFDNRVTGNIDFYHNKAKDLLLRQSVPILTGYEYMMVNIGQTSNKGLEFVINAVLIEKEDFRFSTNFNISFNRSKVDRLGDDGIDYFLESSGWSNDVGADYIVRVGDPVGLMYGFVTDGYYKIKDFTYDPTTRKYTLNNGVANNASITYATALSPGGMKFRNLADPVDGNGDPAPDGNLVTFDADRTVIGNANPDHIGGMNFSLVYKGIDLSLFLNWVYGNDIYNANKIEFTSEYSKYTNMLSIMDSKHRWRTIDDQGVLVTDPDALAALNKNATIWTPSKGRYLLHSWAVEDGSFLRINNLTLGYTLPSKWTKKVFIERFRVYATANNLYTFTRYSGYDPEVDTRRSTPMTPGVDYSAYPRSRMYLIGLNVTL